MATVTGKKMLVLAKLKGYAILVSLLKQKLKDLFVSMETKHGLFFFSFHNDYVIVLKVFTAVYWYDLQGGKWIKT